MGRARDAGLRIHAHAGTPAAQGGEVAELGRRGLLGPDVTLSHCTRLSDADFDAIARSSTAVALTPASDMAARRRPTAHPAAHRPRHPAGPGRRRRVAHPRRHVRPDAGRHLGAARHVVRPQAGGQGRHPQSARHPRRDPLRHRRRCPGGRARRHHRIARARASRPTSSCCGPTVPTSSRQRPDRRRRVGHGHVERRLGLRRRRTVGRARRSSLPTWRAPERSATAATSARSRPRQVCPAGAGAQPR